MDGILLIDKPQNFTSFDVVKRIRSLTGIKKVGHGGTLDPMATGILPIFLGKATKKAKYFLNGDKGYFAEMTLGILTDTLDADGKITKKSKVIIDNLEDKIKQVFKEFTSEINQVPPMFSAVHHKGRRLYELARAGKTVEREPRRVTIHKLALKELSDGINPRVTFEILCSKGTYIRSLVSDIGERLGPGAHLSKLVRTYSHPFLLSQALSLETIENLIKIGKLSSVIINPEEVLEVSG